MSMAEAVAGDAAPYVTHVVPSEYHKGDAEIRVVVPTGYDAKKAYRTLYVLPVEARFSSSFGDPLAILRKMDFPTSKGFVCVMVGYATPPWFGDHPTEKTQMQGRHLIERVIPFVEKTYAVSPKPEHRFLLGFSKSGWGAASLLMRYPQHLGFAGTWDAPWCMTGLIWGLKENFGTQEVMDANRPDLLAPKVVANFTGSTGSARLVVTGEKAWGLMQPLAGGDKSRTHTVAFHGILEKFKFPHAYRNDLAFGHRWDEGWMRPVLDMTLELAEKAKPAKSR